MSIRQLAHVPSYGWMTSRKAISNGVLFAINVKLVDFTTIAIADCARKMLKIDKADVCATHDS